MIMDWKHVAPAYKKVKNTMQQITDQSLSLVSAVKIWNMSLQNTCLTIWKATVYYMIFNMASDILDPVKPNRKRTGPRTVPERHQK
jgi:hypothetical protein